MRWGRELQVTGVTQGSSQGGGFVITVFLCNPIQASGQSKTIRESFSAPQKNKEAGQERHSTYFLYLSNGDNTARYSFYVGLVIITYVPIFGTW